LTCLQRLLLLLLQLPLMLLMSCPFTLVNSHTMLVVT
jgi:hypothetical protein